ncbi:MAG: response regulator, partial [Nitrospiraceae bacterium]
MGELKSASMFGAHGATNGCVMVVEDEPSVRETVRQTLQAGGYDVLEVEDGDKAVETIKSGENPLMVDVIITDVDKPKGLEAITFFKKQFPRISLIGLTGSPELAKKSTEPTKIVILGGGKGGSALLGLFSHLPGVQIVGITDKDPSAPALQRARGLGIPVVNDAASLIASEGANLIVDVTGNPEMQQVIAEHKSTDSEVLGGAAAKLLWNVVQHEAQMQAQLHRAERLASMVKYGMLVDYLP